MIGALVFGAMILLSIFYKSFRDSEERKPIAIQLFLCGSQALDLKKEGDT